MLVQELMSTPVLTIRADKPMLVVQEIMKWNHVRHVPVIAADGSIIGMVSQRDILAASVSSLSTTTAPVDRRQHLAMSDVEKVMKREVFTIEADQPVSAAATLMRSKRIGSLPVMFEGKLIGIITDADMVRLVEYLPPAALAMVEMPLPRGTKAVAV